MIIKNLETPAYKKGFARAKSFTAIKHYDGKGVDDFIAVTTKKAPVLTKSGGAPSRHRAANLTKFVGNVRPHTDSCVNSRTFRKS